MQLKSERVQSRLKPERLQTKLRPERIQARLEELPGWDLAGDGRALERNLFLSDDPRGGGLRCSGRRDRRG